MVADTVLLLYLHRPQVGDVQDCPVTLNPVQNWCLNDSFLLISRASSLVSYNIIKKILTPLKLRNYRGVRVSHFLGDFLVLIL